MKFVFQDRDGIFQHDDKEFDTLEEFVHWAHEVDLPRFKFIPPGENVPGSWMKNFRDDEWMVWINSDYD